MRALFVIFAERRRTFWPKIYLRSPKGLELTTLAPIGLADLLKIHFCVQVYYKIENLPVFEQRER